MKHWTTKEIARLKQLYPVLSPDELGREFAPRSMGSIRGQVRLYKIRKQRDWLAIAQRHRPTFNFGAAAR